tara:strand:+ start:216 stop:680 length:465 start_codon:yes stop_codon:yes gene_type:complete
MKEVVLRDDEVALSQMIGRNRSLIARAARVKDAKIGGQDGAEADVMGFMAEYAFAKIFNVFPDIGLSPRSGSSDGELKGFNYDIKATSYKTGRLLCTTKNNPDVDIYVLAIVDSPKVTIIGYAKKEDLIKEENLVDLGRGKGYALTQDQLNKFQ